MIDGATFFAAERLKRNEKQFQRAVLAFARDMGWAFAYHSYFSDRSEAGYPDAHLLRPSRGESIMVEFKTMKGKLTPAQEAWREALIACGVRYYLWRPCCWESSEIQEVLQ